MTFSQPLVFSLLLMCSHLLSLDSFYFSLHFLIPYLFQDLWEVFHRTHEHPWVRRISHILNSSDDIHHSLKQMYSLKQRHYFADKGPSSQSYGFSSSHVWMWELDHKQIWVPKSRCFSTVVLEKTLESPLECKEIQPVNPKGKQS